MSGEDLIEAERIIRMLDEAADLAHRAANRISGLPKLEFSVQMVDDLVRAVKLIDAANEDLRGETL